MGKYICKRVLRAFFTLFIIITILFSLLRFMPEEGYFENYDKLSDIEIQVKLNSLGLNDPLPKQLTRFYGQLARGDLQCIPPGGVHQRDHRRKDTHLHPSGPGLFCSVFGDGPVSGHLDGPVHPLGVEDRG